MSFDRGTSASFAVVLASAAAAYAQPGAPGSTSSSPAPVVAIDASGTAPDAVRSTDATSTRLTTSRDDAALAALIDERVTARLAERKDTAGWKDGFFVQTSDGANKLKLGGFTQFDGRFFIADTKDPHTDQFGFRSIRPDLQGTLFEHYDFRLLPDFAGGRMVVQDAYVDIHYGDAIKFKFGKFKVPFGLERLQGETQTLFAERGLPTLLAPNRDLGVQVHGDVAKGTFAYQVGVFNGVADGQSGDGDVSDDKEAAARVFVKPFARGKNPAIQELGIGAAVTYGDKLGTVAAPDVAALRTQGQTTFFAYKTGMTLMDTVVADGRHWRATGQASYYAGPVGLLGEYIRSVQKVVLDGSHKRVVTDAWQATAQYVITGDTASFKSVTPKKPFDPSKHQWGAFDVAARIGELRLVDASLLDQGFADPTRSSRRTWSAGGGVDWYPNRSFRFVVDFERTWFRLGAKDGDRAAESSIVGRVQTVF
jgi:phosphate-selective porin OprO/OprP